MDPDSTSAAALCDIGVNFTSAAVCDAGVNSTFVCNAVPSPETQFCTDFSAIPNVFLGISCLSAVCCLIVFATYHLFPRLGGYSSKIFIYRTSIDLLIAVSHIISTAANLTDPAHHVGCGIIGVLNEFLLFASNLWYAVLAWDLIKAIRNPFGARPSSGWLSHVVVWAVSLLPTLVLSCFGSRGPGLSMFYWCWVSVGDGFQRFLFLSFFLYYLPHFAFWLFSSIILVMATCILWGHLAASSETRKFVLKQNAVYVLVLGIETGLIIPLWVAQIIAIISKGARNDENFPFFITTGSFGLAVAFAVIHALRGTVDLLVWWVTFSIGPKDVKELYHRIKMKLKNDILSLRTPLIRQDESINRALRRDAMYCINVGILDAVKLNEDEATHRTHLGSVRDSFVAQVMVQWDEENQETITEELRENNPYYREQSERKIEFPPTGSIHQFSFIDLEPSLFSLLRNSYNVTPRLYRDSFRIKNAADVESSGMLEKFTEGKSGSFFYFTRDFRYIIKTVSASEERFLQKISYRYYRHMKANPDSLIVKFFGLHKVRLAPEQHYITVVVMENIFNNQNLKIHERYDLKGSWVGRRSVKGKKTQEQYKGTMKDLDLQKRIVIGPDSRGHLLEQLQHDVEFLMSCKIMDYSMLLGIHSHNTAENSLMQLTSESVEIEGGDFVDVNPRSGRGQSNATTTSIAPGSPRSPTDRDGRLLPPPRSYSRGSVLSDRITSPGADLEESTELVEPYVPWFRRDFGGLRSYSPYHPLQEGGNRGDAVSFEEYRGLDAQSLPVHTYYFGIVDILQPYNLEKKMEHFAKTRILFKDRHGISAVNEREYGQRFANAMSRIFE